MAGGSWPPGAGPARDEAAHTAHGWSLWGSGGLRSRLQWHRQSLHNGHGGRGSGLAKGLRRNLHRAAPCSAPGRPPRSTGEPPGSSPRGHSERPGRTRPRLRGAPRGADPARPKWAVQRGGGVPGASPPPGRGHAQAPRVTRVSRGARWRCTAGLRIPPSQARWLYVWGVRSAQDSAAAAGHPLLQPGPRGQWRLVIVGAQRAWRRGGSPTPSVLLVEASLTDTLRLRSPEWEAEDQLPFTLARGPGPESAPPAHVRG